MLDKAAIDIVVVPPPAEDLPAARYGVSEQLNLFIPTRDCVHLATDLYLPAGATGAVPTILVRTPYGKHRLVRQRPFLIPLLVGQGYAVVVQDIRGRWRSEGLYRVARGNGDDGSDTLDWIAAQAWSNGRVATIGWSYSADNGYTLARKLHPSHVALVADGAAPCRALGGRHEQWGARVGGALSLSALAGWFHVHGAEAFLARPANLSRDAYAAVAHLYDPSPMVEPLDLATACGSMPVAGLLARRSVMPNGFDELAGLQPDDPRWRDDYEFFDGNEPVDVPAMHIGSWFDSSTAGIFDIAQHFKLHGRSQRTRDNQFVVVSPALHCGTERGDADVTLGDRHLGDTRFPYYTMILRFLDRFLKRKDASHFDCPAYQCFDVGAGRWTAFESWPPDGFARRSLHLHGDGRLAWEEPGTAPDARVFVGNPADPVPSIGGASWDSSGLFPIGPVDQRPVENRDDVLLYTSAPFVSALRVAGPMSVTLWVSSLAPDTDFAVRLSEVSPDGRSVLIQEGIRRCRWREGYGRASPPLHSGEVVELEVDLQVAVITIAPGNRLRVAISGSWFPRFDRNPNTGEDSWSATRVKTCESRVHHCAAAPSRLNIWCEAADE